jgi:hypothetical protein
MIHDSLDAMARHAVIVAALIAATPARAHAEDATPLGADKSMHLVVGGAVAVFGYALAAQLLDGPGLRAAIGGGLALAAGGAKELWDLAGHGSAEWLDLAFDLLGAGVGLLIAVAVDLTLEHRQRRRRALAAFAR